jgi:flagellar basal body-associated protein FliL
MQVQYINLFNQAKQYRTSSPLLSGIVLLLILVLLPLVIVIALCALALFMVYAKTKTFFRSLTRSGKAPRIKVTRSRKAGEPEYASYEIIEEHTNQKVD